MATLKELRDERLRKLSQLKELGINPYPAQSKRTHTLLAIAEQFKDLQDRKVTVVGRIVSIRKFGKIAFIVLRDASGQLQLFLSAKDVAEIDPGKSQIGFKQLNLLDSGDFIEVAGKVIKTQTGEISVGVQELRLLTKSLRQLPTSHHGFTNKEERLRRRYVDTNVNQDVYQRFLRRSAFWQATRNFLLSNSFVEINTPVLENTTGGADANPFVTHMDALGQDFYLRISHELPLKRLLVGGYEKVFDIGPRFRNENYSDEHLPEHIAMEWYWAYADWNDGMRLTEKMLHKIADETWGTRQFTLANGMDVDLGRDNEDWPRISFVDIIREHFGLDVFNCTLNEVKAQLKEHNIEVEQTENRSRGIDKLWKKIRTTLPGPAFLVDIPTFLQPLAKTQPGKPELTEQFNLILGGSEMCKAYSELNDPIDQLERFKQQQAMRDAGDEEAMMLDIDYVEALEYAMPPACGLGFSERLFWTLEGVTAREGVIFPQLRRGLDEVTKTIYPDIKLETPKEQSMRTIKTIKEQHVHDPNAPVVSSENFRQRHAARAVVLREDGKVALLHVRNKGYHKLPGGGVEEGEDLAVALERELLEEVGCQAKVVSEVGKIIEYRDQWQMLQTSFCFIAKQFGEYRPPAFTEEETADGFEIFWADNINHAILTLEADEPQNYDGAFIKPRDLALLKAAKDLL